VLPSIKAESNTNIGKAILALNKSQVYSTIERECGNHISLMQEYVKQPSISLEDYGVRETAELTRKYLERAGCKTTLIPTKGYPVVFGHYDARADKTLLVYLWYDTQKVLDGWKYPPLEGKVIESGDFPKFIVGRGAFNKCSLISFLGAIDSIRRSGQSVPVNLKFVIEGEEILGSPHLPDFVRENKSLLSDADALIFPRVTQARNGRVVMSLGGKGMILLDLECSGERWGRGPTKSSVHSSERAWVDSPIAHLVDALSKLLPSPNYEPQVSALRENVSAPSNDDVELIEVLSREFTLEQLKVRAGVQRLAYDLPISELLTKYLFNTTLNVTRIESAPGDYVVSNRATAKLEVRFLPRQEASTIVAGIRKFLDSNGFRDLDLRVRSVINWCKTEKRSPITRSVIAAYEEFGVVPQVWPHSVASPPYSIFASELGIPTSDGGLGHGGRHHGPDEYFVIEGGGTGVKGLADCEKSYASILDAFSSMK
jgi:acetylornithine deacetylase/succinyl-diaminopimelate desuccinylase-like protein